MHPPSIVGVILSEDAVMCALELRTATVVTLRSSRQGLLLNVMPCLPSSSQQLGRRVDFERVTGVTSTSGHMSVSPEARNDHNKAADAGVDRQCDAGQSPSTLGITATGNDNDGNASALGQQ